MHELGPHQFVIHQEQWVNGKVHVSFVENAWSLFKRGLVGIFHNVSTKYLQDYLDEFAFRYSYRHEKARLMDLVLEGANTRVFLSRKDASCTKLGLSCIWRCHKAAGQRCIFV